MKWDRLFVIVITLALAFIVSQDGLAAGIWQQNPTTGCKVWNAYPEAGETFAWDGACKNDLAEGNGILEWFVNGKFKVRYEGLLVAGKREGKATQRYADGSRYVGDFLASERTGKGIYYFNNGNRYEGDFVHGHLHGQGIFYDANGNMAYKGRWEHGKYVGPK